MKLDVSNDLLRTFVTILEEGSFSKAAVTLHRTQAALSLQLKRLEDDMGVRLLERSPKGIVASAAGSALLPYATRMLSLSAEIRRLMESMSQVETIRIGMLEDIAVGALPTVLERFTKSHPSVRLEIVVNDSKTLSRLLSESKLEIVIADPSSVEAFPAFVWDEDLVWVAANGFELPTGQEIPIIAFASSCPWQDKALKKLDAHGIPWRVALSSDNLNAISSAVSAGIGISFMLKYSVNASARILGEPEGLPGTEPVKIGIFLRDGGVHSERLTALFKIISSELAADRGSQYGVHRIRVTPHLDWPEIPIRSIAK
ncbi:LysR family transcriptional regulator [Pseudomonas sp. EA_5y_Pfl2_R50]|uniref:LysR family transcriptional regulator n=1 Tax=Pseudomonas sp. EA_5y_Pfl2_R50 TaxID=3088691 RepID=UPI0030DC1E84